MFNLSTFLLASCCSPTWRWRAGCWAGAWACAATNILLRAGWQATSHMRPPPHPPPPPPSPSCRQPRFPPPFRHHRNRGLLNSAHSIRAQLQHQLIKASKTTAPRTSTISSLSRHHSLPAARHSSFVSQVLRCIAVWTCGYSARNPSTQFSRPRLFRVGLIVLYLTDSAQINLLPFSSCCPFFVA